jgi:zinc protease
MLSHFHPSGTIELTEKFAMASFRAALIVSLLWITASAAASGADPGTALPVPNIPFTKTVLPNGLTLIVHEDHKAPIVAVNLWYHVGSKNEPPGRTGFAHLFEHLMFGATGGSQQGWFERLEAVGASDINGTTNEDRTNFFETVPTSALDMTLAMEATRMGHLLDHFDEKLLTTQRGVVQNEKRQGENQPYAVSDDIITKSIWPVGHPYSHTVIGDMADLDAAKVQDVKEWFSKYYGPSNAVLVIAGDITPGQAAEKARQYFGAIPSGPPLDRQKEWVAKRTGMQRAAVQDHVSQSRLYLEWNAPPGGSADADMLDLQMDVLANGKSSRLYKRLVYVDQIATNVTAFYESHEIGSIVDIELTAKAGVSLRRIETVFYQELKRLLRDGPTAAELDHSKTRRVARLVQTLERVGGFGGKSDILARSQTFFDDPGAWKLSLERVLAAKPQDVMEAARRWMNDGSFALEVTPFPAYAHAAGSDAATDIPAAGPPSAPKFPGVRSTTLSNGLKVVVAERHDAPLIVFNVVLDEGRASDPANLPGLANLEANALLDGTASLDALAFDDRRSELGLVLTARADTDFSLIQMTGLASRLDPSLDLLADVLMHPAFRDADVERRKALTISGIRQQKDNPVNAALRIGPTLVYGPASPYGLLATEASIAKITAGDLKQHQRLWVQPRGATMIVVGDTTLEAIKPKLEARFGAWHPADAVPKKLVDVKAPDASSVDTIYLIDKPGAQQSVVAAAIIAPPKSSTDAIPIEAMVTMLGGAFTSRLNLNLREDKHWAYGAFAFNQARRGPSLLSVLAPVQSDKTVESLAEVKRELSDVTAARPLSKRELELAQHGLTLSLPGRWETDAGVAASLTDIAAYNLPADYYDNYSQRVGALSEADVNRAAQTVIRPAGFLWLVIGDQTKLRPQLEALGLKVKSIDADGMPANGDAAPAGH